MMWPEEWLMLMGCSSGSLIEIVAVGVAAEFGVLITGAADQLAGGGARSFGFKGGDQFVHIVDFLGTEPGDVVGRALFIDTRGVQVNIVEAGGDSHAVEIDDLALDGVAPRRIVRWVRRLRNGRW